MKKLLSVVMASVILTTLLAVNVSAAPKPYDMPKAKSAPTIDGAKGADEWKNALTVEIKKGEGFCPAGSATTGGTFSFMWSDAGVYFIADIADTTVSKAWTTAGSGSYNAGDGIQFNIFTSPTLKDGAAGKCLFFSYVPKTTDGKPAVGEHFGYSDGSKGANVPAAKVAAKMNGAAYVIEGLIPAEAFTKVQSPVTIASGAKIYMNNIIMDQTETGAQSLIIDNEWFDGAKANIYTMSNTEAGAAPSTNPGTSDSGITAIFAIMAASFVVILTGKRIRVKE